MKISGNQRVRGLVNMVDGVEHPNRAPITFIELLKTHEAAHCPDKTRRPSDSLFLDVFVQLLFSIRLIGNNTSLNLSSRCLIKTHNRDPFPIPPDIEHDLLWMKRLLGWLKVIHSAFPKIFFAQQLL